MAARESQQMVDFFSADSSNRGEVLERESSHFQQTLKPPPPVALSLRTRESSALALKQIFDQIYSSAESNPNNNGNSNSLNIRAHERRDSTDLQAFSRDASNAAFQASRGHVTPPGWQVNSSQEEHKTCVPETEPSLGKGQTQGLPVRELVLGAPSSAQTGHLQLHQTHLPQAVTRASPSSPLTRQQPTAQLTIFYSGTVNVYDNVPADKANAIMLLAGTGNPMSMKQSNEGDKEAPAVKLNSASPPPLHMGTAGTATGGSTNANAALASIGKGSGFSLPPASNIVNTTVTNTISSPVPSLTMESKPQVAPKRMHTGIELPQARKASLARFLEKRKDRVQVKQHGEAASQLEEKGETNREEAPPSPKKPYLAGLSSSTLKQ